MAFQPLVEVAVHLGAIRNVCLARKGLYHVRCSLTVQGSKGRCPAVPHHIFEAEVSKGAILPAAVVVLPPVGPEVGSSSPQRDSDTSETRAFRSQTVPISHAEEVQELNDLACFRLELGEDRAELNLELELMFLDMPVGKGQLTQDASQRFVTLDSEVLRLTGFAAKDCLKIYQPVTFHEPNFCCVDLLVFASLVDYRLRARPAVKQDEGDAAPSSVPRSLATLSHNPTGYPKRRMSRGSQPSSGDDGSSPPQSGAAVDLQNELLNELESAEASLIAVQKAACPGLRTSSQSPPSSIQKDSRSTSVARSSLAAWAAAADAGDLQQGSGPEVALRTLLQELSAASLQLLGTWQELLRRLVQQRSEFTEMLRADWKRRLRKQRATQVLHAQRERGPHERPADLAMQNRRLAEEHRHRGAESLPLENGKHDVVLVEVAADKSLRGSLPVVFEQRSAKVEVVDKASDWKPVSAGVWKKEAAAFGYARGPGDLDLPENRSQYDFAKPSKKAGKHVLVLVHGFQGSSWDLQLFRNQLSVAFPDAVLLCATANEADSECDLRVQGARLAQEVKAFLTKFTVSRLSFVAHSMGGVVVRTALPDLMEYGTKLFTFMSFGSPHLGYGCASSSLFSTGLWLTQQVKAWPSVKQLTLGDIEQPSEVKPFLEELARVRCLEHFQHIVLVTSAQDQYTPFESARLEMPPASDGLPAEQQRYASMLKDILDPIAPEQILRLDVNFHFDETNLDTFIGRAAHIELIENQSFFEVLIHCYSYLFETRAH